MVPVDDKFVLSKVIFMSTLRVVVVGNGMVGHHYVETLATSDIDAHITVIGGESRPAYDRVHLSEVFDGKEPSDLAMTCLLYTSPSPRDQRGSRMPSSA